MGRGNTFNHAYCRSASRYIVVVSDCTCRQLGWPKRGECGVDSGVMLTELTSHACGCHPISEKS